MSLRLILIHFIYRIVFGVGIAAIMWVGGQFVYAKAYQRYALSTFKNRPGIQTGTTDIPVSSTFEVQNGILAMGLPERLPRATLHESVGRFDDRNEPDPFFRDFQNIEVGDSIQLSTSRGTFRYFVTTIEIIDPSEPRILESPGHSELTIFTSRRIPISGAAPQQFVVHARPLGQLKN